MRFIDKSFDDGIEVKRVFLDKSKAFDKFWHEGVIFKLEQNGISDDLLNILRDFLRNRKQRVVLKGQVSTWISVKRYTNADLKISLYIWNHVKS